MDQAAIEKVAEIKSVRLDQMNTEIVYDVVYRTYGERSKEIKVELTKFVEDSFAGSKRGLKEAMVKEREYQKCCYRRTACKELEKYILGYNQATCR
jgi:hypothetical protein